MAADRVRERSVAVDSSRTEYTIAVGGKTAPENLEIEIENIGGVPVVNPRIAVDGRYDWFDTASILSEATAGATADEEKAMAIWSWLLYKRVQRAVAEHSVLHPVRGLNGYSFNICGHNAAWMKALLTAAGVKARVWELKGHTVAEAFYDGGWHLFDANAKAFYLDRDNRTVAGIAALQRDPWLISRTIHARDPWFRGPDSAARNAQFAGYLVTAGDNHESDGYDAEFSKPYTMAYSLRPGEKLTRWWKPVLGKYAGQGEQADVPEVYANGRFVWAPDWKTLDRAPYARGFATGSPYPIVGGRLWCRPGPEQASVTFGAHGNGRVLYTFRPNDSRREVEIDLDAALFRSPVTYSCEIGFPAAVEVVRSMTDVQVSPHSLPALSRGVNRIMVRHDSPPGAKLRITHRWKEIDSREAPGTVEGSAMPAGETGLAPELRWSAARGAADYQVTVSMRPDCAWPVSPSLHRNTGSAVTAWRVPETFLNPGTTYYWRVRARSAEGEVGPWSRSFAFTTARGAR